MSTDPKASGRGEASTLSHLFASTVAKWGDHVAFHSPGDDGDHPDRTWNDYAEQACRAAAVLADRDVGRDDRVAIMLRNRAEFHSIDVGTFLTGATPFSVYNSSSPEQVQYLLGHAGARLAIVEADFVETVEAARPNLPMLQEIITISDDTSTGGAHHADWSALLRDTAPVDLNEAAQRARPDDLATLVYTSGTTGPPKAVMLSHRNLYRTAERFGEALGISLAGRRMVSYLPMAHLLERMMTHYLPMGTGAQVTPCADLGDLGRYLLEVRPEVFVGPPRIYEKLRAGLSASLQADPEKAATVERGLEVGRKMFEARSTGVTPSRELQDAWDDVDADLFAEARARIGLDACAIAVTGAAPVPEELIEFYNFVGIPLVEGYGLSETSAVVSIETLRPRLGSVGRPIPGCEVRLREDGEILCRGDNLFPGYLNDDAKTAEVMDEDGWFHTGDIGTIDDDGYLRILDRKKELIITAGGKNISPANLEARLKQIDIVGQACVIGEGRPYLTALLVLDPEESSLWAARSGLGNLSLAELARREEIRAEIECGLARVNERFSRPEQVRKFLVVEEEWLPDSRFLTPSMKLKRRGVAEHYEAQIHRLYQD